VPKANAPKGAARAIEGLTIHAVDRIEDAIALMRDL
jgi:DNA repair protein RadA/Sms